MRQWLILGMLALSLGVGLTGDCATLPIGSRRESLQVLQEAMQAAKTNLQRVQLTGWVLVRHEGAVSEARQLLGWSDAPVPEGERREVQHARGREGEYVAARWTLSGDALTDWPAKQALLQRAFELVGTDPVLTVQLEGETAHSALVELAQRVLDRLAATERQHWSSTAAVSVAGRTVHLPPGPYGTNVQVAVRRASSGRGARVWLAWPALLQEY